MPTPNYSYLPEEDKKIRIALDDWSMLVAKSRQQAIYDEIKALPEADRIKLSTYHERDSDWFNPYAASQYASREVTGYSLEWWNGLSTDEKSFYQAAAILGEQILGKPVERYKPIDFYRPVEVDNALDWYYACPDHLRRRIDAAIDVIDVRTVTRADDEATWDAVAYSLGDRPRVQYDISDGRPEIRSYLQVAVYKTWCVRYRQELIKKYTVALAPAIQEERRLLNKAMGLDVDSNGLPSQAEGLDATQAATIRWIQASGEMPLEFLARTYRSEDAKMSDRITAARTLMDYAHRRIPVKQEIETEDKTAPKLDPKALRNLSAKELDLLEQLLEKLGKAN